MPLFQGRTECAATFSLKEALLLALRVRLLNACPGDLGDIAFFRGTQQKRPDVREAILLSLPRLANPVSPSSNQSPSEVMTDRKDDNDHPEDEALDEKKSQANSVLSAHNNVFDTIYTEDSIDARYLAKAQVLNQAIQDIGMGKYQWQVAVAKGLILISYWPSRRGLFFVTGFGWFADNLWPIATGLILPPTVNEFNFNPPFIKLGQNVGLFVGAAFWGVGEDIWGRRISFNITMLIIAVFALAGAGSPNWIALSSFAALWSVGAGGNLPVDSAIFLEFLPASHQYLLTTLSIWWTIGQLVGSLVAWPLIANYSCETPTPGVNCPRSSNMGWRYFLIAMGALMLVFWILRLFVFELYESPKYLMGKGRNAEAVEVVHRVAKYNGTTSRLSVEDLDEVDRRGEGEKGDVASAGAKLRILNADRVKSLFATQKLAYSTTSLIILWALIGLAFPLYNSFVTYYLAKRGAAFGDGTVYTAYRNQVILSVTAVPGALFATYLVNRPRLGRRGTLSLATALTGTFILASTTSRSSNALLGWNCAYSLTSNIMYGVLDTITPELFSTKARGTGNAITAMANRIFGVMAPIIALYADVTSSVPIFIAGAIFVVPGVIALLLPFESRGHASL